VRADIRTRFLIEALATGRLGAVICLQCERRFLGPNSGLNYGKLPGDVFVDEDGSLHARHKRVRAFLAEMREWANMCTGDPLNST